MTLEQIKQKLENGVDEKELNEMLFLACQESSLEAVKLLVENGANVNENDENDITPLMIAAQNDQFEIGKYLIESGADVNATDTLFGKTPLMYSATSLTHVGYGCYEEGLPDTIQNAAFELKKNGNKLGDVLVEIYKNKKDFIDFMISKGADIGARAKFYDSRDALNLSITETYHRTWFNFFTLLDYAKDNDVAYTEKEYGVQLTIVLETIFWSDQVNEILCRPIMTMLGEYVFDVYKKMSNKIKALEDKVKQHEQRIKELESGN